MTSDTSVLGLMLDASIPVMLVMVLLVMASLMSWSIIFAKRKLIRRTKDSSDEFETADIERVRVETYSLAAQLTERRPRNTLAGKFSLPFALATVLVNGHSGQARTARSK